MKRLLLFWLILLFLPACSHDKYRVAVIPDYSFSKGSKIAIIPSSGDPAEGIIADGIAQFFMRYRIFDVVERRHLIAIVQEQGLRMSGATETDFIKAGKFLNVQYLLFGSVMRAGINEGIIGASYRIVEIESGRVVANAAYTWDDDNPGGTPGAGKIAEKIGVELCQAITGDKIPLEK